MGYLHIYCGDGKGKTTAALGLAIRAAGAGKRVFIIQLMKGSETSELNSLKKIENITVERCDRAYGFTDKMTEVERQEITACHNRLLEKGFGLAAEKKTDMLIIDEFCATYNYGLLDRKASEKNLLHREFPAEVVITGRDPAEIFVNAADYISEIKCIKHPYDRGVPARRGIEY